MESTDMLIFKYFISDGGGNGFCRRFKDMLGTKDQKYLDKGCAVHTVQSKDWMQL